MLEPRPFARTTSSFPEFSPVLPQIRRAQQAERFGGFPPLKPHGRPGCTRGSPSHFGLPTLSRNAVQMTEHHHDDHKDDIVDASDDEVDITNFFDEDELPWTDDKKSIQRQHNRSSATFRKTDRHHFRETSMSGKDFAKIQGVEALYTGYGKLVGGSRKQAHGKRKVLAAAGGNLRPGQVPFNTTGSWRPNPSTTPLPSLSTWRPNPSRTPLPSLSAPAAGSRKKRRKPIEVIESATEAMHHAAEWGPLPDACRVIWRFGELADAAEGKQYEDLEMARHRREKVCEAGQQQRRRARERHCHILEMERLEAARARQMQQDELAEKSRAHAAQRNRRMSQAVPSTDASDLSDSPMKERMFGAMVYDMMDAKKVPLGEIREHDEDEDPDADGKTSVLGRITLKHDKDTRVKKIKEASKNRRREKRLHRLLEHHRLEFESKPEEEKRRFREAFRQADTFEADVLDARQLGRALEEFGLVPKTDMEKKDVKMICDEVGVLGEVDFLTFCTEAVPRTRKTLKELRRIPLYQQFDSHDVDKSGYLDVEECEQILDRLYSWNIDAKGLTKVRKSVQETLEQVPHQHRDTIDFPSFEALVSNVQEHYERLHHEREEAIMEEEDLDEADVAEHSDELVSLYDSFTRGNLDQSAGMDKEELRVLLIEYGLYPRSLCGQARLDQVFDECDHDSDGSLVFSEFLVILRHMRELAKFSSAGEHQRMFEQYDRDGSGSLGMAEISQMLSDLGMTPRSRDDQQDMKRILDAIDADGSGQVSFNEFQNLVQRISEHMNAGQRRNERKAAAGLQLSDVEVAEMRDAFYALDAEGKGILAIDKLRWALDLLRIDMSAEQLQDIIERLDVDSIGGLNFEEFLHFMKEVTANKPAQAVKETTNRTASAVPQG